MGSRQAAWGVWLRTKARFAWPMHSDTVVSLSVQDLNLLLDGYDVWRFRPHEALRYASMY